jgi:hypothetical protein
LAIASTLLDGAMRPREGTHQFMIPQPPAKSVRPSRAPAKIRASADGGWMSEKYPLLAEEEECFFLTSPFIEPDGLERLAWVITLKPAIRYQFKTGQRDWPKT